MSNGEYEPFELEQPEISEETLDKLERVNAERKLALSRALVEQTSLYLQRVREQVQGIKHFWAYSLLQHIVLKEACSIKSDIQALSYLNNIELKQSTGDPRPFELTFHFDENPYFTNTTLTKTYVLAKGEQPAEGEELIKAMQSWSPAEMTSEAIPIDWKAGQNLIEKYPRHKDAQGDFEGDTGSFFHYFTEKNDPQSIGLLLQADILPEVFNYFTGEGENCEQGFSDLEDDELDEETGDEEEIDLEAEEENAKKRRRV